ncbi:MAG: radical SAM protein [Planctomycetes bacterium]|nr:radical SAM protein [Planctomycetota bacterium]
MNDVSSQVKDNVPPELVSTKGCHRQTDDLLSTKGRYRHSDGIEDKHTTYDLIFVDLFVTENCNCRCEYCFVEGKNTHSLTPELARKAVDFLIRHSGNQTELGILLFGGEPLLEFDLICEIVDYSKKATAETDKSITFSMTTNGTLMTEPMMEFMAEQNIRYLLSLDGDKATHDAHRPLAEGGSSFELIAQRLPLMKSYQPWQGARVTPMPDTVHRLRRDVQTLFELGINQFIIGTATGIEWPEDRCSVFLKQMKEICEFYIAQVREGNHMRITFFEKGDLNEANEDSTCDWGCGAGRGRIGVNTRGEIFGCGRFVGLNDLNGALPLGDIINGFTYPENRAQLLDDSAWKRIDCIHCGYANRCNAGCPAVNYGATGSIYSPPYEECQSTRVYAELKEFSREYISNNLPEG